MRFWVGEYPPSSTFHPEQEGWNKVCEPSSVGTDYVLAVPVTAAQAVGTFAAFAAVRRDAGNQIIRFSGPMMLLAAVVGVSVGTLIAHEALHLMAHPRFGFSASSVVGIWPMAARE